MLLGILIEKIGFRIGTTNERAHFEGVVNGSCGEGPLDLWPLEILKIILLLQHFVVHLFVQPPFKIEKSANLQWIICT